LEVKEYKSSQPIYYKDRWSPLLKVLSRRFGTDETKELAERECYGTFGTDLWTHARQEMNDGELINVAVKLNSLAGVKATMWPGLYEKTCGVKECSTRLWGEQSEITQFICRMETFFNRKS